MLPSHERLSLTVISFGEVVRRKFAVHLLPPRIEWQGLAYGAVFLGRCNNLSLLLSTHPQTVK
jgi:hypothetical protein